HIDPVLRGAEDLVDLHQDQVRFVVNEQQVGHNAPRAAWLRPLNPQSRVATRSSGRANATVRLGMPIARESSSRTDNPALLFKEQSPMRPEPMIIERVETFVHHPVFAGSDQTMDRVLDDLESLKRSGQIGQAIYRRLREMILRSPHIVSGR